MAIMNDMTDVYYLGDLCYILDDNTWDNLCDKLDKQKDENIPVTLPFPKGNKEISCYITQTQYGDGGYEMHNINIHNIATIIYHPSEIGVDSGTVGLICLNQLCLDDSELLKLVKEIKESDYGLVFAVDKAKLELAKLSSEMKPVLTVESTTEYETTDCHYCSSARRGDLDDEEDRCYECNGDGEIEDSYNVFSHEVKLGHHTLFKVIT